MILMAILSMKKIWIRLGHLLMQIKQGILCHVSFAMWNPSPFPCIWIQRLIFPYQLQDHSLFRGCSFLVIDPNSSDSGSNPSHEQSWFASSFVRSIQNSSSLLCYGPMCGSYSFWSRCIQLYGSIFNYQDETCTLHFQETAIEFQLFSRDSLRRVLFDHGGFFDDQILHIIFSVLDYYLSDLLPLTNPDMIAFLSSDQLETSPVSSSFSVTRSLEYLSSFVTRVFYAVSIHITRNSWYAVCRAFHRNFRWSTTSPISSQLRRYSRRNVKMPLASKNKHWNEHRRGKISFC